MSGRIVVIGDALLDVRVVATDAPGRGRDTPARIALGPGGQGANVAARLARRGVSVALVTALAQDAAGTILRNALRADGVKLREVAVPATGTVVVLADADGERTMLSQRAPFAHRLDVTGLDDAAWIVVSGYLLHELAAVEVVAALPAIGPRRVLLGCHVPDDALARWRASAAAMRPDLWIGNRDELARLAPGGIEGVAVTEARGASVRIGDVTAAARSSAGARDTTGAGDAFAAGLLGGLRGAAWPPSQAALESAVEAAVALASDVARVEGAQARIAGEPPATLR